MLKVVETIDDMLELREWFQRQPHVALDTETTGLDVFSRDFSVRTIQFGNKTEAWFVPFIPWQGMVAEILDRYDGQLLVHNASYDVKALARHDVHLPWHQIDDTFIAMRLAEPHLRAGLKPAATRHVSRSASASQEDLKKAMRDHKWDWATIPINFPAYVHYSAMDVILLARLWETEACRRGVGSPVYGLEMDVLSACSRMETNGLRVNREFVADTGEAVLLRMGDVTSKLEELTGGINTRSNAEFARWIEAQGVPIEARTETGQPSVTKDSLEYIALDCAPSVARVIKGALLLRKLQKIKSSYLDNFLDMSDGYGFLHPSIETIAAKTGRMSIRNPALQTLPSDNEDDDFKLIRQSVIPRDETHKLVSCDYSQIELRAIASASEDKLLIDAFLDSDKTGIDFFTQAMRTVYDDPSMSKGDRRRHGIKTLFYAFAYGAGIKKIAATAKMPVPEMTEIRDKVLARYPGMKTLSKRFEAECRENEGWIKTLYGRDVYVDPDFAYKALNGFVQGSAADILKVHLVELAQAGFEDLMVVPVHDEVVFSIPTNDIGEALPVIRETMTDFGYSVPLLADPSHGGDTWGELK